ncbi:hypothetical protein [Lactobacillus crispatus]|uniref:hypothetical protein n=1 Tax=Lactobacillus crispatus TaxID=47770 RepID=UPI000B5D95DF|nr:hypothetical protein [Lactobacillus crispatus]OXC33605.1 hypothetical protein AYP88_08315 [Lactobacillus crispatus]
MFNEFPRLKDAVCWAKANQRKLQSIVEVEYYDSKKHAWRATLWVEGLPAQSMLIHEEKQSKCGLTGKNVVFDTVFKTIQKQDLQEIWIHQLKILC